MKATFAELVIAIIGLVVLITLLIFFNSTRIGIRDLSDSQICKASIEVNARLRYDKISTSLSDIKCPTLFIESPATSQGEVFSTLALALADTWNEFLQGQQEIFDTSTQNYCVVRRVVEFKEAKEYNGFFSYLIIHNPPNIKQSYFTYLSNVDVAQVGNQLNNLNLKSADVINTANSYAAIFFMSKKATNAKQAGAVVGGVAGAAIIAGTCIALTAGGCAPVALGLASAGGALVGGGAGYILTQASPATWDAGMMLIPYNNESLNKLDCTKLPISITKNQQ